MMATERETCWTCEADPDRRRRFADQRTKCPRCTADQGTDQDRYTAARVRQIFRSLRGWKDRSLIRVEAEDVVQAYERLIQMGRLTDAEQAGLKLHLEEGMSQQRVAALLNRQPGSDPITARSIGLAARAGSRKIAIWLNR